MKLATVAWFAIVILFYVASASGQWQRVTSYQQEKERRPELQHAHSLKWFLTASPARIIEGDDHLAINLRDYNVTATQQLIGRSFGRKIFQIVLSLRPKKAPDEEQEPPSYVKSLIMESSPGKYRELYQIVDAWGTYLEPLSTARLVVKDGAQFLVTADDMSGNGGFCTGGEWALQPDGPWLLDWNAVREAVRKTIPANAAMPAFDCMAGALRGLEFGAPIQGKNAGCKVCDWLGSVLVRFRIEGHKALPVSSSFKQCEPDVDCSP